MASGPHLILNEGFRPRETTKTPNTLSLGLEPGHLQPLP